MILPDINILVRAYSSDSARHDAARRSWGTAGNLTTDAHLAALAIEYQAEVASTDTDFMRFPRLRWFNPLM